MFTKEQISKMKEEEFQNTVLIPLFHKMGFRDVTAFGGGSLELGKDIVMWKTDDLGQRVNYGVVVKAKKITGNAETNNGAMNVLNQVRQMLKTSYINPVNGQTEYIERCFVASSQEIKKEAMNSIKGELENNLDKLVRWIHPKTNLFELIERYLPEQGIFEKLSSVQEELDKTTKDIPYKLVASSDKRISILGKHDKAHEEMPLEFRLEIEGKENLDKWDRHVRTGEPVEIEGKFTLPDFFSSFIKPDSNKKGKIIIEPLRFNHQITFRIERKLNDGNFIVLDNIQMEIVQMGNDELTLKNDKQQVPWQFTFVINFANKSFNYEFVNKFRGFNVSQHLKSLQFFASMFEDGETSLFHVDTEFKIVDSEKQALNSKENFDAWFRLLEALVLIQQKTSTFFNLPDKIITNEEAEKIYEVEQIIKNGKINGIPSPFTSLTPLDTAKEIIETLKNETTHRIFFRYQDNIKLEILNKKIDLGVAVTTLDAYIKEQDFRKIQKHIKEGKDTIEIPYTPINQSIIVDFLKWDCEDRHTRFQITDS